MSDGTVNGHLFLLHHSKILTSHRHIDENIQSNTLEYWITIDHSNKSHSE